MWSAERDDLDNGRRFRVVRDGTAASFRVVFEALAGDPEFAAWYTRLLCEVPYEAWFWEHPPLTVGRMGAAAELVLLDAPALARARPNPRPFRRYFAAGDDVAVFENLGRDALLVAPAPIEPQRCCAHLAAFLRQAPAAAVDSLWRVTARTVLERVGERPLWLSTSGLGVAWVHIRLDSFPKYYQHAPYRRALS